MPNDVVLNLMVIGRDDGTYIPVIELKDDEPEWNVLSVEELRALLSED